MDREAKKQYGRRQKKEIEDKKISDAIVVLKNCDDYELRKVYHKQLIELLCSCGYTVDTSVENPIDLEVKILIRADLDSYIPRIDDNSLSSDYMESLLSPPKPARRFLDTEYRQSMQKSKGWQVANQFTSFQKVLKFIRKKLAAKKVDPKVVEQMTVMDCMHFVSKNCKSAFRQYSLKKKFVQTFIRHNEKDLRSMHHLQGLDVRYTNALIEAMKNDGVSCGIKLFDENGTQIKGPEYHIHHRIPVKNAGETNFFSEVNLFKNLVLIEKDIYHKLVHMCEKSECVANKRYFSKLLTPNNSALISGLEPQDVIYYDFEKSTKIINKALEDVNLPRQENVVQPSNSKENNSSAQQKNKFNFDKMRHNKKGGRNG